MNKNNYPETWSEHAHFWQLEKDKLYLNHGAFGACPLPVLDKQSYYRVMLEKHPLRFMLRELDELVYKSKDKLAEFVGCSSNDMAFITNATQGVNTVFRSLKFRPGDEIIFTNHVYPACRNVVNFIAEQTGAVLREVQVNYPPMKDDDFIKPILNAVNKNTRIALVDHITSSTALIFPVEKIVRELEKLGVDTLVDGAHAPGSIQLNISEINSAYYTGNCHKWICAPKGAAFLYIREDKQQDIFPLSISHVAGKDNRFHERFHWTGTDDPSAALCVGDAIDFMGSLYPGGWKELMERNHNLAINARKIIAECLNVMEICPERYIPSMATLLLPDSDEMNKCGIYFIDAQQDRIYKEYDIEIPFFFWPQPPKRLIRIAAQAYNTLRQFEILAEVLCEELKINNL